eukprot:jgi/Bigna1/78597/fgenesh1_pg.55_\
MRRVLTFSAALLLALNLFAGVHATEKGGQPLVASDANAVRFKKVNSTAEVQTYTKAIKTVDTAEAGGTCGGRMCPSVSNPVCCDTDQYCCPESTQCVSPNRLQGDLLRDWVCVKANYKNDKTSGRPLKIMYGEATGGYNVPVSKGKK